MEETAIAVKLVKLPTGEIKFYPLDEESETLLPIDFVREILEPYFGKGVIMIFEKENGKLKSLEIEELPEESIRYSYFKPR